MQAKIEISTNLKDVRNETKAEEQVKRKKKMADVEAERDDLKRQLHKEKKINETIAENDWLREMVKIK